MQPNNPIILNSPQPQSETDRIKKLVSKKTIKGLSIIQMVCAGIAIITQITLLGNRESLRIKGIADIGAGLCRIICCSKQDNSGGVIYSPGQIQPQQFI